MFIRCSLLFAVLTISRLPRTSSHMKSSNNLLLDQPAKSCPSDGIPVCGMRDKQFVLFSNVCLLHKANKDMSQAATNFRKVPLQYCMTGCEFSCTEMYKPVCARNIKANQNQLFQNHCELMKYICKTNTDYVKINLFDCLIKSYSSSFNKLLEKRSQATKGMRRPVPCMNIFKPVCGSYMGVKSSFINECLLNAENVDLDRDWRIVSTGLCPEDYAKVRRRKDKPSKRHLIKKRSYHNNLYNHVGFDANSFVNNKNGLNVSPNDLFVYMPPTFQTQFVNDDTSLYQHGMPERKTYEEIFNKIATYSPPDMSFPAEEYKKGINPPIPNHSNITPLSFAVNYLSDQSLAHDINRPQSISPPAIKPFSGKDEQKEYYYAFKNIDPSIEADNIGVIRSTDATQVSEGIPGTSSSWKDFNKREQLKGKEVEAKNIECKFGSVAICAALSDGTLRTFETICDMMTANVYFEKTWTKLHEGACEDCKYNCSRDYQPLCISRNSVNYTMVNECYYNMAICMDKKSKWKKLSNNECERYTRIPDKYANTKPGFPYTSSYFVSQTTELPSTDPATVATTTKAMKVQFNKSKKRRPNIKRAIARNFSSVECCTESHNTSQSQDNITCECWDETTPAQSTTESHIMSLVKENEEEK